MNTNERGPDGYELREGLGQFPWGDDIEAWLEARDAEQIESDIRAYVAREVSAERERWVPDVDELAQHIRLLNGNKMGAGVLAEKLVDWLGSRPNA